MGPLFSLVALKLRHSRWLLRRHGFRSHVITLEREGCHIHFWAPSSPIAASSSSSIARSQSCLLQQDSATHSNDTHPHIPPFCNSSSFANCSDHTSSASCGSLADCTAHSHRCNCAHHNRGSIDVQAATIPDLMSIPAASHEVGKPFELAPQQQISPSLNSKPALLMLHGFGGDGTFAWENQVTELSKHFSLYLPDLLFFGGSTINAAVPTDMRSPPTSCDCNPQTEPTAGTSVVVDDEVRYSEAFQAKCMYEAMTKMGVQEAVVLGHSYGGFVAYQMAHLYPSFVKKLVILSSGIMMNPRTNDPLLAKAGIDRIHDLLVPTTLPLSKKSLQLVFNDFLPAWLPSFIYKDMFESLAGDREGRRRLVDDIVLGKEGAPPLPTIQQRTVILWGEDDQIFDISLAHQLKEFLGDKATLVTMKGVGHVPHMVRPKGFNELLLASLSSCNRTRGSA